MLRIKEIRKQRNMSQAELAAAIGSSQVFVCEMENGRKQPSFDTLVKLARALSCSLDDLVVLDTETAVL